jgi:hypothetical protein
MKNISVKVVQWNYITYPTGCDKLINCDKLQIIGTFWRQPVLDVGGNVVGYNEIPASQPKPSTDSYKVVKAYSEIDLVTIIIDDAQTSQIVLDACAVCCGDAPIVFNTPVPPVFKEQKPCTDANGNRVIVKTRPICNNGIVVTFTANGDNPTPDPQSSYATAQEFVTWANANWSAYGTWELVNGNTQ